MSRHIPVSQPLMGSLEGDYVNKALSAKAISGHFGEFLPRFEESFSRFSDCSFGIATTGGTTALHLAVATLNIGLGDEVLVSSLTMMSPLFAILYQGAVPVPIDIEPDTLNMDTTLLESRITSRTKAIMVVHLFGHPVDMDPVLMVAKRHGLVVIEDCAEAHGATYKGKKVGSLGDMGCFSFYANKIVTTGEGGMVTTNSSRLAERARSLKGLAFGESNKFMHHDIGFNYRMSNLQAALGCAQMESVEKVVSAKRRIASRYREALSGIQGLQLPIEKDYAYNVYWMYHMLLTGRFSTCRSEVLAELAKRGVETREGFIPANLQDILIKRNICRPADCPKAALVAYSGFYIPSGPVIDDSDLDYVAKQVREVLAAI